MKWITGAYILILAMIVALADQKAYQYLFAHIKEIPFGDKCGHLILMGLFSLVVNRSLACRKIKIGRAYILQGSVIVLLVVTLEEVSQLFIPYRTFDLIDLLFDYLGIFSCGLFAQYLEQKRTIKPAQLS